VLKLCRGVVENENFWIFECDLFVEKCEEFLIQADMDNTISYNIRNECVKKILEGDGV
jgi:hypothetical protein